MSTSKHIDKLCAAAMILALLLTLLLANGTALGIQAMSKVYGYETRLFDSSNVHTIDIVMDDWDGFIETCEDEEYTACAVVIDNEAYKNVGIRAKGNTSLSSVSQLGSQRYSFKIEFDHYDSSKSYYGLDKLSLNNLIQDNTMLKDYLCYQMMLAFGVDAPLCSFVYITVNGEDWGLYLAVEGIEDAFLQRNYGGETGDLYKPDSTSMGGGRGNGKGFDMDDVSDQFGGQDFSDLAQQIQDAMPEDFDPSAWMEENGGEAPDGDDISQWLQDAGLDDMAEQFSQMDFDMNGGGDFAMGSDDAKLQYIDDDPDSYSAIFSSAKTTVTDADQARLIAALKALGEGDVESCLDMDEVLRYFVVHNYVVNGDSYTGSMIHNYYLYEQDGILSMIPWDYNLSFGGFLSSSATDTANDPIDTPLSVTGDGSRPMVDWIFQSEEYTALYHQYFAEFLESVDIQGLIESAATLIDPYVEQDPTKFCTYEEFQQGVTTLETFCQLRSQSVSGQLDGTIPSTSDGQKADSSALVDASGITITDMGSMNSTMGGGMDDAMVGGFGGQGFGGGDVKPMGQSDDGQTDSRQPDDAQGKDAGETAQTESDEDGGAGQTPTAPSNMGGGQQPVEGNAQQPQEGGGQAQLPQTDGDSSDTAQQPQEGDGNSSGQQPQMPTADGETGDQPSDGMAQQPQEGGQFGQSQQDGQPGAEGQETEAQSGAETFVLLAVSLLALAIGLVVAFKYRK